MIEKDGSLAQLNRASDYGSEGYRFESCANHIKKSCRSAEALFMCMTGADAGYAGSADFSGGLKMSYE